jgi:hypothetical protein
MITNIHYQKKNALKFRIKLIILVSYKTKNPQKMHQV